METITQTASQAAAAECGADLSQSVNWEFLVEVLQPLQAAAFRAMRVFGHGTIDQFTAYTLPSPQREQLHHQCRAFANSMNPLHREVALRVACVERSPELAIARYARLLDMPLDQLMRETATPSPVVTVLWKCGQCGRLYEANPFMCSSGHLSQHTFPVEVATKERA